MRPLYQHEIEEDVYRHELLFFYRRRYEGWVCITEHGFYDSLKPILGGMLDTGCTIVVAYEARHAFHNPENYPPKLAEDEGLRLIYDWEWAQRIYHNRHEMLYWYCDRSNSWKLLTEHDDYHPGSEVGSYHMDWTFAVSMCDAYVLNKQLQAERQATPQPSAGRRRRALNI